MILSVFAANKLNATPITAPAGYHLTYHYGGNWTDWGQTLNSYNCNNQSHTSQSRQCIHYLSHEIINVNNVRDFSLTQTGNPRPTSTSDPRFQQAFAQNGFYGFWFYGGYATIDYDGNLWTFPCNFIYLTADGSIHGVGTYNSDINKWEIFDQSYNLRTTVNPGSGFYPDSFYIDGKLVPSSAISGLSMRIFYIDKSSKCEDYHNGRFIKGAMYCYWGAAEQYDYPYQYLFDYCNPRDIGPLSDRWSKPGRNQRWYFFGKDNLKEKLQSYSGYPDMMPSYALAKYNLTAKGINTSNPYDTNGNINWNYNAIGGYEVEHLTHTIYKYKCDGHLAPNTYTVVYNGNGATGGSMGNSAHTYDVARGLNSNGYSKANYHFKGWSTSPSGGVSYTNGQSVKNLTTTNGGVVNLYAVWEPDNKTVTYIDRVQGTSTQLGSRTVSKPYGSTVAGSDIGADKTLHKYYTNYEYVSCTSATVGANGATVYRDFKLGIAPYTVHHQQEQLNGSYVTVKTDTPTGIIGSNVTPPVNTYTGFTSPPTKTVTVAANGTTTVIYQYKRNDYPVTFIDLINGTELGRTTSNRKYGATVNGNEIGSSTADNAYYKNYSFSTSTSATVGTNGATVYRHFTWLTVNVDGSVSWTDNSGKWGTRPGKVKVALFQNKNGVTQVAGPKGSSSVSTSPVIGLAALNSNQYGFSFHNLPKYDTNGVAYVYEVRQGNENDNIVYSNPSYVSSVINPEDKYVTTQNKYNIVNALDNTAQDPDNPDIPDDSNGFHVDGAIHWVDSGNRLGYRPDTVKIQLFQDGAAFIRDGEPYILTIDAKDDNTYSFVRLPKYRYENGEPVPYRYTAVETVSSVYLLNGKLTPAYDIHVDEEYGQQKALHFTNYFKTRNEPIVPFIPDDQKDNTITIKMNTDEPINVTFKMLDYIATGTPDDIDRVDGPGYNGVEYNLSVDELGEVIKHIPSGKYEIEIIDNNYELKDMVISDNTDNVHIVKEDDKYYLVIEDTPDDSWGTVNIELEKKEKNYQTSYSISNYFRGPSHIEGAAMMSMFDVSAETGNVSAEMPSFTITYNESEVVDDNKYGYGDYAEIHEFEGEIPEDMIFANWIDQDGNELLPGDEINVVSNLELSPVFEFGILGTVSGGDSIPLDEENLPLDEEELHLDRDEALLDKEESTLEEESHLDDEDKTVLSDDYETAVTEQDETSEESMYDVEESDGDGSEEPISIEDEDITKEDDSDSMTESDDGSTSES